jgi:ABC-type protease/lipase transport system fused ATPase/permease subunit
MDSLFFTIVFCFKVALGLFMLLGGAIIVGVALS